ncbi:FkbM family methyltransferase [Cellulomonas fengjieae]|uniref:FkbM family methyltransferase n=1 Tax=Cellulomonas fengjieae TaxID=2819978 RepID=UPI001AAFE7CC|nr:FkbM family methyltransferase [Cellulomonas fengjieae]QVI64872.1 FkbM family methyltransferase [Cellulomonas fengjieae]
MLWRALRGIPEGRYVDVGANDPRLFSVTRGFYELGWSGITIEPVPAFAAAQRAERPRDTLIEAAVTDEAIDTVTLHVFEDTGLSTLVDEVSERHVGAGFAGSDVVVPARTLDDILAEAGWDDVDIHFMVVDVEGAEAAVIRSADLARWRPWVLVIESTAPLSTEPTHEVWEGDVLAAGYTFCLFDGLSRFYVSPDHPELVPLVSYPACPLDEYDTDAEREQRASIERLTDEVVRWRTAALTRWADRSDSTLSRAADQRRIAALEAELVAVRRTVSWRLTAPLRAVRGVAR